jgi:hypothetical protein
MPQPDSQDQAQTPPASADSPGSTETPESTQALERELARTQAELEQCRSLIEELPSIYEGKFTQRVRAVAADIQRLLQERRTLQVQISRALDAAQAPAQLVAADPATPRRQIPRRTVLLAGCIALGLAAALAVIATQRRVPRPPAAPPPRAAATPPDAAETASAKRPAELRLRARGEAWLEVQNLRGDKVFVGTLQNGQERRLPLGDGLRVRSGRADLLEASVGGDPPSPLGPVWDLGWKTFSPPEASSQARS